MVLVAEKLRLLWLGAGEIPANVEAALDGRWDVQRCATDADIAGAMDSAGLVLICPEAPGDVDRRRVCALLDRVDRSGAVGVVLMPDWALGGPLVNRRGQCIFVDADASPADLAGRLQAAAALQPAIRDLRLDMATARASGTGMNRNFEQVDEEMRLAARLQRDFLPRAMPSVGNVRFATLFRPAGWVSGDIYDVFRLDETRVGFYIADVVGHGMPAALLTMFIKKSLQTKRIVGNSYAIVPPNEALAQLNTDICLQDLTSCQFCTAVYGIVDTAELTLQYARGGHPVPVLLSGDGTTNHLNAAGALLGVFPEEKFQLCQVPLVPGDRVVFYSDGAEDILAKPHETHHRDSGLVDMLEQSRHFPPDEATLFLAQQIDRCRTDNQRDDDVSVVILDVLRNTPARP
jgi:serine phosphatase RsbU (regulator of sigma subunit)